MAGPNPQGRRQPRSVQATPSATETTAIVIAICLLAVVSVLSAAIGLGRELRAAGDGSTVLHPNGLIRIGSPALITLSAAVGVWTRSDVRIRTIAWRSPVTAALRVVAPLIGVFWILGRVVERGTGVPHREFVRYGLVEGAAIVLGMVTVALVLAQWRTISRPAGTSPPGR